MLRAIILAVAILLGIQPANADDQAKRDALLTAYPSAFTFDGNYLVFPNQTRLMWDDGRQRSAEALLVDPDVEDMFHYVYPLASEGELVPAIGFDPGRVRSEPFFKALYGGSASAVSARIVAVPWAGGQVRVTSKFGVADRIKKIGRELSGELAKYATKPGGGYIWRTISGSTMLSPHSFGTAFDINTASADYWIWAKAVDPIPYKNRIPLKIVELFERRGFIWGGRWYHYDTMHFEYRPELIEYAKRRASEAR